MTIGERIKNRREQLNISVDEVAKKLGKHRATIYRYESNEIESFPTDILEPLATVLQTTPAYLMGWEPEKDEPIKILGYHEQEIAPFINVDMLEAEKNKKTNHPGLDELDKTMLSLFQKLTTIEKCEVITNLKQKNK